MSFIHQLECITCVCECRSLSLTLSRARYLGTFTSPPAAQNHCLMGGVQERFCYTVFFDVVDDIVDTHVYFQFIAVFTNTRNERYGAQELCCRKSATNDSLTQCESPESRESSTIAFPPPRATARISILSIAT